MNESKVNICIIILIVYVHYHVIDRRIPAQDVDNVVCV